MLSDDGRVFHLESEPFFDAESQSAMLNQSHLSQACPGDGTKVSLQPIKILTEASLQQLEGMESNSGVQHVHEESFTDRIKDVAVSQNGMVALNEKGEVLLITT